MQQSNCIRNMKVNYHKLLVDNIRDLSLNMSLLTFNNRMTEFINKHV